MGIERSGGNVIIVSEMTGVIEVLVVMVTRRRGENVG